MGMKARYMISFSKFRTGIPVLNKEGWDAGHWCLWWQHFLAHCRVKCHGISKGAVIHHYLSDLPATKEDFFLTGILKLSPRDNILQLRGGKTLLTQHGDHRKDSLHLQRGSVYQDDSA